MAPVGGGRVSPVRPGLRGPFPGARTRRPGGPSRARGGGALRPPAVSAHRPRRLPRDVRSRVPGEEQQETLAVCSGAVSDGGGAQGLHLADEGRGVAARHRPGDRRAERRHQGAACDLGRLRGRAELCQGAAGQGQVAAADRVRQAEGAGQVRGRGGQGGDAARGDARGQVVERPERLRDHLGAAAEGRGEAPAEGEGRRRAVEGEEGAGRLREVGERGREGLERVERAAVRPVRRRARPARGARAEAPRLPAVWSATGAWGRRASAGRRRRGRSRPPPPAAGRSRRGEGADRLGAGSQGARHRRGPRGGPARHELDRGAGGARPVGQAGADAARPGQGDAQAASGESCRTGPVGRGGGRAHARKDTRDRRRVPELSS